MTSMYPPRPTRCRAAPGRAAGTGPAPGTGRAACPTEPDPAARPVRRDRCTRRPARTRSGAPLRLAHLGRAAVRPHRRAAGRHQLRLRHSLTRGRRRPAGHGDRGVRPRLRRGARTLARRSRPRPAQPPARRADRARPRRFRRGRRGFFGWPLSRLGRPGRLARPGLRFSAAAAGDHDDFTITATFWALTLAGLSYWFWRRFLPAPQHIDGRIYHGAEISTEHVHGPGLDTWPRLLGTVGFGR